MDDILHEVQFVMDPSTGKKSAVLINYAVWEKMLALLAGREAGEGSNKMLLRPFGLCAGEFNVPDDFDSPLPEYVVEDFEGER